MTERLEMLLLKARLRAMDEAAIDRANEWLAEQRISFAYGNVNLSNSAVTREDVERAAVILARTPDRA